MRRRYWRRAAMLAALVSVVVAVEYMIASIDVTGELRDDKTKAAGRPAAYFDEYLTRPGERYVSLENFLDCLDARLNVDYRTKTEHPFANVNATIPYLVLPVTVEQGDMKALMCNMSVQIRHMMYVQNGGVGSMTAFLDRVQDAFAFTSRLKIPRMPENYAYSVALNVAVRDALSLPFDEVPFILMANNDVRIPGGMLEHALPQMYAKSLAGRARIAELEAEVATEPNEHTPARFRDVPLRSTDGRHVLVTSRLLPDRIRYQPKDERRRAFADYYGSLYISSMNHSAFWGVTRLAIEVTGYFDENCYPIYYEDTDYMRRMWLLGFKPFLPEGWKGPPMLHFSGGSIVSVKGFVPAPQFADVPPFVRGSKYMVEMQYSMLYILSKYNLHGYQFPDSANKEPHDGRHLPLDVYVLNEERNRAIFELQRLAVWYYSTDKADAALGARSPLAYARLRNATFLHKFVGKMLDGASYYRDGNALRLRPSLA